MRSALARLAEDPEFYVEPPEGAERIVDDRYCVTIGSERRWAGVCHLRIADDPAAVAAVTGEILGLVGDIERTIWNVGSTAEPPSLPERRLRALGWRDPEPPWDPVVAAMVLAEEPPAADGIEVRRIETFGDHLAGLEIMLASDAFSEEARARERAEARQTFERRIRRGGLQWLARRSATSRSRSRLPTGAPSACTSQEAPRSPRRGAAGVTGLSSAPAGTKP